MDLLEKRKKQLILIYHTNWIKKNEEPKETHQKDTNRIKNLNSLLELHNIDKEKICKKFTNNHLHY